MKFYFKNFFKIFSKSPVYYWSYFLIFIFSLFIIVVLFGVYEFRKISKTSIKPIAAPSEPRIKIPNKAALNKAIEIINQKEADLKKAADILPPKNP
ncbi:MAG: hypothetical protein A3H02_01565 [Candidatus Niyogibacteria bacterium RIFCSPLOWO2_12_FULL_41_13]|uniref:Uncharacterized protein n=1 Tax=Candidatus Niyogibacteria bacterium RIFCSPLOWO2_12_FULL_41_13 TaxID=1801726 RepID=A0A1G2F0Y8_9BACT|nr:MAG: hypothetical protein A3H02_01565 [Candidatus Niyogibacteria bacterium RIFCSPLOWO2_12_FULL_41_13]